MMSFGFLANALLDLVINISNNGIFPVIIYYLEYSSVRYILLSAQYVVPVIPGLQCPADSSSNHGIQSGSFHHHASSFLLSFTPF